MSSVKAVQMFVLMLSMPLDSALIKIKHISFHQDHICDLYFSFFYVSMRHNKICRVHSQVFSKKLLRLSIFYCFL
ncbi:hypothetical protein QE152_g18103 [Popillia japonica]|uniref:Secreted protein n=1 Tax=Popillia japonica TaxID=7064 RepID=A0AAW1L5Y2_POPJA